MVDSWSQHACFSKQKTIVDKDGNTSMFKCMLCEYVVWRPKATLVLSVVTASGSFVAIDDVVTPEAGVNINLARLIRERSLPGISN